MRHVVVDGANVVGSRPDGWWRDRAAAARRLAARLVAALAEDPQALLRGLAEAAADDPAGELRVHLVLEGAATGARDLPTHPQLRIVLAPADGDSAIVELAAGLAGHPVVVVTADRALRTRVHTTGAATVGPGTLLRLLPQQPA